MQIKQNNRGRFFLSGKVDTCAVLPDMLQITLPLYSTQKLLKVYLLSFFKKP